MIDLNTEEWQEGQPTERGVYCAYVYEWGDPEDNINLVSVSEESDLQGKKVLVYRMFYDDGPLSVSSISYFIGPIILPKPPAKVITNPTSA